MPYNFSRPVCSVKTIVLIRKTSDRRKKAMHLKKKKIQKIFLSF